MGASEAVGERAVGDRSAGFGGLAGWAGAEVAVAEETYELELTRVNAACVRIVVPGERPPAKPKAMTYRQVDHLLSHLEEPDRLLFHFLSRTGLRISEALGLQWRDLETGPDGAILVVRRQCLHGTLVDKIRSEASHRSVALIPSLVSELREDRHGERRPGGHGPIFPSFCGSHRDSHNVRRRLRKAANASGLPWVTPHVFRHSFATEIRNRGYDSGEISKVLGHRSEAFTRLVYIHATEMPRFDDFDDRGTSRHATVPSGSSDPEGLQDRERLRPWRMSCEKSS